MRFALIEMDVPARSGLTREGHAHARGSMEGKRQESKGARARDEAAGPLTFVAALINGMLTIRAKTPPL